MITKAGLIPYVVEDRLIKMLFMVSSDARFGGPDPMISKGNIDPGETPEQAAIREAEEELGLQLSNLIEHPFLISSEKIAGMNDEYVMNIYACQVKDKNTFSTPHYETAYTLWLTLEEFHQIGRTLHQPIVRKTIREIISSR